MQPWGEPEAGCLRSSRTYSNIRLSKSPRIDTVSSINRSNTRHVYISALRVYGMKKLSMGIAALMMVAPAPFAMETISSDPMVCLLILIMAGWSLVEFYIGLSRPCRRRAPSRRLVIIGRMLWPIFIIYTWVDFDRNWTLLYLPFWLKVLLLSVCIFALGLRVWTVIHLGKSFSYEVKRPEGGILITTGPYKIVRHPAYLAICILGSFPGLILGSIVGFIGLSAATVVTVICRMVAEETMLENEFGDLYTQYQRNTCRLVPFIY